MLPFRVSINHFTVARDQFELVYDMLTFKEAPPAGTNVYIDFYDKSYVFPANGTQHVFKFKYEGGDLEAYMLMQKAVEHRNHPAVEDLLMQLRVVLELVNE